jgi:hypothetical protein
MGGKKRSFTHEVSERTLLSSTGEGVILVVLRVHLPLGLFL